MLESDYREIIRECQEFGWLGDHQLADFRRLEQLFLDSRLGEIQSAADILAAIFLAEEYLEEGVALAPWTEPPPRTQPGSLGETAPEPVMDALASAAKQKGTAFVGLAEEKAVRLRTSAATIRWAESRGFTVLRAAGRRLPDGRRDRSLAPLIRASLETFEDGDKLDRFLSDKCQYLQLLISPTHFCRRPGKVFNIDPGSNRLKLFKACLELFLRLLASRSICLVAEEIHLFPGLARKFLAYLAWVLRCGDMGLTGLGEDYRTLDRTHFAMIGFSEPPASRSEKEWLATMSRRNVRILTLF